jgi:hypothetical protein
VVKQGVKEGVKEGVSGKPLTPRKMGNAERCRKKDRFLLLRWSVP